MKNKFIDVAKVLNRMTTWAHTSLRSSLRTRLSWAATGLHRLVREFKPWGIILTLGGLVIAFITIAVDLEDRQSERTFRAWQIVQEFEDRAGAPGSSLREALQFLNREFDGAWCGFLVSWPLQWLTGNGRECLFPRKIRESLARLQAHEINLEGIVLAGADLTRASLIGVILRDATLQDANLRDVKLIGADLTRADLTRADLTRADLSPILWDHRIADALREHDLGPQSKPADFKRALQNGSTCADLSQALQRAPERFPRASTDLSGANLSGADLSGANLLGANLSDTNLRNADLSGAILLCVDLTGAEGTDLSDADTTGVVGLPTDSPAPRMRPGAVRALPGDDCGALRSCQEPRES